MTATMDPTAMSPAKSPIRSKFGRRKFDKQPTQPAGVLIASIGEPISKATVRRAVELAAGKPVAVICTVRIYGSAYGLPNPGLMPTKRELDTARGHIEKAISAAERAGVEAWGQLAATRKPTKTIAAAARARGVEHVLLVIPETARWRQAIEGDLVREVGRRVGPEVTVERA